MSHVATIDIEINDLEALTAAAKRLGGVVEQAKTYKWWGRSMGDYPIPAGFTAAELGKCHHKINFPELNAVAIQQGHRAYEVGIIDKEQLPPDHPAQTAYPGRYILQWDFFYGPLCQVMGGDKGQAMKHAYGVETTIAAARRRGHRVTETKLPNGRTRLEITAR